MDRRNFLIGGTAALAALSLPPIEELVPNTASAAELDAWAGLAPQPVGFITIRVQSFPWNIELGDWISGSGLPDAKIVGISREMGSNVITELTLDPTPDGSPPSLVV